MVALLRIALTLWKYEHYLLILSVVVVLCGVAHVFHTFCFKLLSLLTITRPAGEMFIVNS